MAWDTDQYLKFADHRTRPAIDLLNRIGIDRPTRVVDLGCGAGNVTRLLAERWPRAQVVGIDPSPDMLARARREHPDLTFTQDGAATWQPDRSPDVLYSSAALHWLGDHETLFPSLFDKVAPGGWLAVQMPRNFGQPSHTSVAAAAEDGPWGERLAPLIKPAPTHDPAVYLDLLAARADHVDVWETDYIQILSGENPVAEWTKGTWLRPFLDALEGKDREGFEAAYRRRVRAAYPPRPDGKTVFPFRRLFLVLRRGNR